MPKVTLSLLSFLLFACSQAEERHSFLSGEACLPDSKVVNYSGDQVQFGSQLGTLTLTCILQDLGAVCTVLGIAGNNVDISPRSPRWAVTSNSGRIPVVSKQEDLGSWTLVFQSKDLSGLKIDLEVDSGSSVFKASID